MGRKRKKKRCGIYARVSTDAQARKDYSSNASQIDMILRFIKHGRLAKFTRRMGFLVRI
ncbi:MAG: hypothetical protein GY817_01990 [bacterium]|nr:hypothetical protein [bacterium]